MPNVYATNREIDQIRDQLDRAEVRFWIERLLQPEVDRVLPLPPDHVPEQASSGADWTCPRHNTSMAPVSADGDQLKCPVDGELYAGPNRRSAVRMLTHEQYSWGVRSLALLHRLQTRPDWAARARQILNTYADRYEKYPVTGAEQYWMRGKAMPFALMETTWIQALLWGADLLRQGGDVDDATWARWRDGLFLPCAAFLQDEVPQVHNIRCWLNSAVGSIGLAFDRPDLVRHSLDHEFGFRAQMIRGQLADGTWCETSTLYQWYCLQALLIHAEAAIRHGINLYDDGRLARLAVAATRYVMPDLTMAPINDTASHCPVSPFVLATCRVRFGDDAIRSLAERRIARFREEAAGGDLSSLHLCRNGGRAAADLLLLAADISPEGHVVRAPRPVAYSPRKLGATPLPDQRAQACVIRDDAKGHYVLMEHGPKEASHMHYERLGLVAYLHGQPVLIDRGSTAYHLPIYNFYRYTPAHNTVALSTWHHLHQSVGALLEASATQCKARVEIHPGILMTRSIRLEEDTVLDEIEIESRMKQFGGHFDLYLHPAGEPVISALQFVPVELEPLYFGYEGLTHPKRLTSGFPSSLPHQTETGRIVIGFESVPSGAELILVDTPGCGHEIHRPIHSLIVRHDVAPRLHYRLRYRLDTERNHG